MRAKVSARRWCVLDRERVWHAAVGNEPPHEGVIAHNVEVSCGGVVVLPWGLEERAPSCPACVAALASKRPGG